MFAVVLLAVALVQIGLCEEYTSQYDGVDLDELIKNDRLMKNYVDCLLDKGKCTPDGEELKKDVPDALQNECSKCSAKHKEGIRKMIRHLIKNKQEWWKELEAKYDPKGEYKQRYQKYLEEEHLTR